MRLSDMVPGWLRAAQPADAKRMTFAAPVEIAAAEGEGRRPSFDIAAYSGASMNVAGFYTPVVVDLAGLKAGRAKLPVLLDHDPSRIVGQGEAKIDAAGVRIVGLVTGDDADAAKVVGHAKNGFEWQASIGAEVNRREFLEAGKKAIVNGREVVGPMVIARESTLREVSFVAIGADSQTSATVAASLSNGEEQMQFQSWLKAKGFDGDTLSESQKATLEAAFHSEGSPPPVATAPAPVADVSAIRAESARIANIQRVCGGKFSDIEAKAIAEGWEAEKAELEVLRASRVNAPAAHVVTRPSMTRDVLEAAVAMHAKLPGHEKDFAPQTLEAAHKTFRRGIGLQELFLECAWANGYTGRTFRGDHEGVLRAAFSSNALSGILSATANKFLLRSFDAVESAWRAIAATRSVADFKTVTSYRMTGDAKFRKVGPGGELEHASMADMSYTNKAETYGRMFAITRQDQINDDLGAFTAVPGLIGRGAALQLNTVFWTEFMDNASFFTTGNGSYFEGGTTNLQISSLTTAEKMFFDQTDADGNPLGVMPKTLLVPNALNVTATQLTRDTEVRDTTASTKYTTGNPHAGKFSVVRSAYLSNTAITGYSTTAWYLLADPADMPVIEVAFLNGQESPVVETAEADFNTLGVQMRGYFDFGVNKQEYRGGVKSKGAA